MHMESGPHHLLLGGSGGCGPGSGSANTTKLSMDKLLFTLGSTSGDFKLHLQDITLDLIFHIEHCAIGRYTHKLFMDKVLSLLFPLGSTSGNVKLCLEDITLDLIFHVEALCHGGPHTDKVIPTYFPVFQVILQCGRL